MGGQTGAPAGFGRAAWTALRHGQQIHGIGLVPITTSFTGAANSFTVDLFQSPGFSEGGRWRPEVGRVTLDTSITAAALAANSWTFRLRNAGTAGTDTDNLSATGRITTTAITARTPVTLTISTTAQTYMLANEVLQFVADEAGTGTNLAAVNFTVTVFMRRDNPSA